MLITGPARKIFSGCCRALCRTLAACALLFAANGAFADTTPKIDAELRAELKKAVTESSSFVDKYDAEVWLTAMSSRLEPFIENTPQRLDFLRAVHHHATKAGLRPEIVLAVIEVESRFDRYAISRVGAQGVMQVMPFWKNEIGRSEDNLIELDTNLKYGCTILKHYLDKAEGRLAEALARYNGSYGSYRYAVKVMDAWERRWR